MMEQPAGIFEAFKNKFTGGNAFPMTFGLFLAAGVTSVIVSFTIEFLVVSSFFSAKFGFSVTSIAEISKVCTSYLRTHYSIRANRSFDKHAGKFKSLYVLCVSFSAVTTMLFTFENMNAQNLDSLMSVAKVEEQQRSGRDRANTEANFSERLQSIEAEIEKYRKLRDAQIETGRGRRYHAYDAQYQDAVTRRQKILKEKETVLYTLEDNHTRRLEDKKKTLRKSAQAQNEFVYASLTTLWLNNEPPPILFLFTIACLSGLITAILEMSINAATAALALENED